ncbi:MAG: hypothetical protein AABN95_16130 [Acidobacteriota bacterium]
MAILIDFDECLLDPSLFSIAQGGQSPFVGGPEYANAHLPNKITGVVKTAVLRFDELERGTFDLSLLRPTHFDYLLNFINGGYGSAVGFRCRFPHFNSMTLETIAGPGGIQVPNGVLSTFKLYKSSIRPGITARSNVKRIIKPVVQAAKATGATLYEPDGVTARKFVGDSNAPTYAALVFRLYHDTGGGNVEITTGWTVNVTTGIITYTTNIPATGTYVRATCSFDLPMAFTDNQFNLRGDIVGQAESVGVREIGHTELGIAY